MSKTKKMSLMTRSEFVKRGSAVLRRTLYAALLAVVYAALWWTLNDADIQSWVLGAPVVVLAVLISLAVLPTALWRVRLLGLARFALHFLGQSLFSGVDVAGRVLRPSMPLKPGIFLYPLRLPAEPERVIMAFTTSLLPGTLSVDLNGDALVVHALDMDAPVMRELRRLEERIAGAYGVRLTEAAR